MSGQGTVIPVTLSGWYECQNGDIARYEWRNGRLVELERAKSWAEVGRMKLEAEEKP